MCIYSQSSNFPLGWVSCLRLPPSLPFIKLYSIHWGTEPIDYYCVSLQTNLTAISYSYSIHRQMPVHLDAFLSTGHLSTCSSMCSPWIQITCKTVIHHNHLYYVIFICNINCHSLFGCIFPTPRKDTVSLVSSQFLSGFGVQQLCQNVTYLYVVLLVLYYLIFSTMIVIITYQMCQKVSEHASIQSLDPAVSNNPYHSTHAGSHDRPQGIL